MSVKARSNVADLAMYVPGKPMEEVQQELGLTRVIKLASNENPWGPSPRAIDAARKALEQASVYPDANASKLKKLIAADLGVEIDQLVVGNGSEEVVQGIAKAYVDPGDEVIMAEQTFPRYKTVTELMNGIAIEVPLKDYRHDLKAMAAKISPKTKALFICNPNNPSGTIVSERELDEFMASVPDSVLIVFDEAYFEYVSDKNYGSGLKYLQSGSQNVLVLRTFAKAYGLAGLRMGFGVGSAKLIDYMNRVRDPFNGNLAAQEAAAAAWQDKEYLQDILSKNAAGKLQLKSGLEQLGCTVIDSQANFLLTDLAQPSQGIFEALLRKGIIVRPGHLLGYPTFQRITVGTPEQNTEVLTALKEILQAG